MVGATNLTDEQYRTFGDYQPSFGFTMEAFDRGRQWYAKGTAQF
jgi:iron complex outermembrane receptor protein